MAKAALRGRSWLWLQGMVAGALAVEAPGLALLVGVLLVPVLVGAVSEKTPTRPATRSMLLMGAAGTFWPLRTLWQHDLSLDAALDILTDPTVPLASWACCCTGWLIGEASEMVTSLLMTRRTAHMVHKLRQEQSQLIAEWGGALSVPDVTKPK